jgi:hypothetical protein
MADPLQQVAGHCELRPARRGAGRARGRSGCSWPSRVSGGWGRGVSFLAWTSGGLAGHPRGRRRWLVAERNPLEPEAKGLPVDAGDYAQGQSGVAQQGSAQACRGDGLQRSAEAGLDQGAVGVVMVDAGNDALPTVVVGAHEPETILAIRAAERGHVEDLVGTQFSAECRLIQQVAVPLAEGVVDLGDDRAQVPVGGMAVPETHRFEGVAQHPRIGLQPGLAGGILDAGVLQECVEPGQRAAAVRRCGRRRGRARESSAGQAG